MHVVQVTQSYPPSQGGVENHVEAISTRLVEAGHKITVISADAGTGRRFETRNGVAVRRYRSLSPDGAYHFAPQVADVIRKIEPDIVHAHNYHALLLPFAAIAARDATLIVTPHYHGGSENRIRNLLLRGYHPIGQWIFDRTNAVVAVSEWESTQLQSDFGIEAEVIPNGIDVDRFSTAEPHKHNRPYLLCVGRLERYKGVQYAIRTMTEFPDHDLLIAGSGPYRKHLENVAEQTSVEDRVRFLGHVPDQDLPGLYCGAEVFITLSSFESFGLTVGEALAAGTPCVILRQGALVDWEAYEAVLGVDSPDTDRVCEAVNSVRSLEVDKNRIPTWSNHVERLTELYHNAA
ncbi:glycosyltransferase family 4 protein [Halorubrum sp. HHNYT27]|uniref:glycosyltransferase family 4 protein n=1 Tax=Halorubrum sp. HHNYT27 TaxID=3402275 RepID=UPI003EBC08B3